MGPTAAERRGLEQLKQEYPGYTVTLNRFGHAELTPPTPEQQAIRRRQQQPNLTQRAKVLLSLEAA